jgi:hypothetical protein
MRFENHPNSKLDRKLVSFIRSSYDAGETAASLADELQVSLSAIYNLVAPSNDWKRWSPLK